MRKKLLLLHSFLKHANLDNEAAELLTFLKTASRVSLSDLEQVVDSEVSLEDLEDMVGRVGLGTVSLEDLSRAADRDSGDISIEDLERFIRGESPSSSRGGDDQSDVPSGQSSDDIRQIQEANSGSVQVSAPASTGRVSEGKLYSDLMAGIGNSNLCIAMVANAIGESGMYPNINGDCGEYAENRGIDTSLYPNVFKKPDRGRCCSFGLWQYNICGGLGISLLEHYGASKDSPDEEKFPIITSYTKQVEFMIQHVKGEFDTTDPKTIDEWVRLFVYRVERPADMAGATIRRQEIARGLNLA
tara:strand:+ start:834 stop:1736 length:903 start_codon:yes stop_codon:yes gene_type:complete